MQELNLRPYGNSAFGATAPVDPASAQAQLLQRARDKFEACQSLAEPPAKGDIPRTVLAAILAVFPVGLALLFAFALWKGRGGSALGAFIAVVVALGFASIPWIIFSRSRPVTPQSAFKNFFRTLSMGSHKRARALAISSDLDGFPRIQPIVEKLGQPTGMPYRFQDPGQFKLYWDQLLRPRMPAYCRMAIRNVRQTPVAANVVLVEADITITTNSTLWGMFILLGVVFGLVIYAIVDAATRTSVKLPVRKVLVKVGKEWRIFNAELMGVDEHDLSWLQRPR